MILIIHLLNLQIELLRLLISKKTKSVNREIVMDKPKIINCFCSWYDLLGYGNSFKEAKWNLNEESCLENYQRIKKLGYLFQNPFTYGKTLTLNDGVIKTFDVSSEPNVADMKYINNFLISYVGKFFELNEKDKIGESFGVRGVFTFGQRYEYMDTNFTYDVSTGEILAYFPKEFQKNTAFSKANIIEESGKAYGIKGPYLYFDKVALEEIKKIATQIDGYNISEKDDEEFYYFSINILNIPSITLIFAKKPIKYNHKSIETELYQLKDYILQDC